MRRMLMMLTVLAAATVGMGCENGQQNTESMRVPPPAYDANEPEPMPATADQDGAVPADEADQPAPEPEPVETSAEAGSADTYTVQKGDTLWSIAVDVYGDGQRWVDIVDANPGLNPEKLAVGQTLTLP